MCVMSYTKQLDARLREEALALVRVSLGSNEDFEYIRTAAALCEFEAGRPKGFLVCPRDPRSLAFLRELQIVKSEPDGFRLNIKVNTSLGRPMLAWDWEPGPVPVS
jgi:hypothetical protein